MATPAMPPQILISPTSKEYMAYCQRCKRALPLRYFQKNANTLKTCYQCRDATQLKRRTDRKKVKALNGILTGRAPLPPVGQMSTEDLTEEILTNLEPVHGQPALRHPVRSESVPMPRHKAAANPDGHSLLQLPPDIPDFNDSSDAEYDATDSGSKDDASSSAEETKGKPDVDTEETKPRISELREIFDQLRTITDTGTEILSLLKEAKAPGHQPSPQMSPSSKMSIEAPTKSPHESTTCGSDDGEDDSEISGPDYFVCLHCEIPRSTCLQYDGGVCAYCYEEQRFCVHGNHEASITDFVDCDGIMHDICSECREKGKSESVITDLVDFDRIKSEDFNGCRVKGESEVVINDLVDFDHFKKEFFNESKVKEEI